MAELALFNVGHGFTESLVRGLRSGFLSPEDYRRLSTADSLEDVRSALEETDYGTFLQDEPSPLLASTITKKCYEKLADEFRYVKAQCNEPLTTFMDFIAREKMIDNVCMIVQGALNQKPPKELLEKVHPLGVFDGMKSVMELDVTQGFDDVYNIFLIDSPIGPYFDEYIKSSNRSKDEAPKGFEKTEVGGILNKQDLEVMKASLKKAWLEDFHAYVMGIGGTTGEVMGHMLKMEADFRVLLVTLNALHTPLSTEQSKDERNCLYPNFGYLYPEGAKRLREAWSDSTVSMALENHSKYLALFNEVKQFYEQDESSTKSTMGQSIEDLVYKENVKLFEMAFEQQYHFGVFYAWVKLREQEVRNIRWICDMIVFQKKDKIDETIVPIFQPRMV